MSYPANQKGKSNPSWFAEEEGSPARGESYAVTNAGEVVGLLTFRTFASLGPFQVLPWPSPQ
jgi:hypothetical protein